MEIIFTIIILLIITLTVLYISKIDIKYYISKNSKDLSSDSYNLIRLYQKCYSDPSLMTEQDWEMYEKIHNQPLVLAQWKLISNEFINTLWQTKPYDPNKVIDRDYKIIPTPTSFDEAYSKVFNSLICGRNFNAKHIKDVVKYTMVYNHLPYGVYLYNWRNGRSFKLDRYSPSCSESKETIRKKIYKELENRKKN